VARQGYLSLLTGDARTGSADTATMVAARAAVLGGGRLDPVVEAVATACEQAAAGIEGCVVDVGAGTGAHLAAALERLPGRVGVALDLSKHALRRAARAHPAIGAVRCDAWRELPLRDGVAAVGLSVFAPRDAGELARVVGTGGALVVAGPTERHLAEVVAALGTLRVDERRRRRLERKLGERFAPTRDVTVERALELTSPELKALVAMGPSARHLGAGEISARVAAQPEPFATTLSVTVSTYART
jgi:23S rRNA (guanine745-N1)-methyltransferase